MHATMTNMKNVICLIISFGVLCWTSNASAKFWIFGSDKKEETKVEENSSKQKKLFVPYGSQKEEKKKTPFNMNRLFGKNIKPKYSYKPLYWGGMPLPEGFDVTYLFNIGPEPQTQQDMRMIAAARVAPQENTLRQRRAANAKKRLAKLQARERGQNSPTIYQSPKAEEKGKPRQAPYVVRKSDKKETGPRKVFTDY